LQLWTPATYVTRSEERCHEQPHPIDACRLDGQQKDDIEAGFRYRVFDRSRGRHDRLGVSVRLGRRQVGKLADGLDQIFSYPAPIMIHSATFTSITIPIAHLRIFDFR
jgi:hypothetical protein